MRKDVKVGIIAGRGGPIGKYRWSVLIIDRAYDEVMKILNAEQYAYIAEQVATSLYFTH